MSDAGGALGTRRRGTDLLHLDMDCFFAAVEVLDDPALAGRPVVVGGTGHRGVVSSASYEARAFGVHSAMPTVEARGLCPQAVFISPRHDRYGEVSGELLELMRDVTPLVEPLSLDEAFLDVAGAHRILGTSEEIARRLRAAVSAELGLACSVGGGRSKLIAKLASKAAKPRITADGPVEGDGVLIITEEEERAFLDRLPVRALPGIGPRTAERLARLGITQVSELATLERERLVSLFGKSQGGSIFDLANGVDDRPVEPQRALKSIGHEETFESDLHRLAELAEHARRQSASVAERCRRAELYGRTVSVKLRFNDFSIQTRGRTADHRVVAASEIAAIALELLAGFELDRGVRLLGVSVSNLVAGDEPRQLSLFAEEGGTKAEELVRHEVLDAVTDRIRDRFGKGAIATGADVGGRGAHRGGPGD